MIEDIFSAIVTLVSFLAPSLFVFGFLYQEKRWSRYLLICSLIAGYLYFGETVSITSNSVLLIGVSRSSTFGSWVALLCLVGIGIKKTLESAIMFFRRKNRSKRSTQVRPPD